MSTEFYLGLFIGCVGALVLSMIERAGYRELRRRDVEFRADIDAKLKDVVSEHHAWLIFRADYLYRATKLVGALKDPLIRCGFGKEWEEMRGHLESAVRRLREDNAKNN